MHFFNIATNLTNKFMIGYEDDLENFYLKGETMGETFQISCRIFDSKGHFLFALEINHLSPMSSSRFRIESEANKLVIIDNKENILLHIETQDEALGRVTYIRGQFFDKNGRLAARGDERGLLVNCPLRM